MSQTPTRDAVNSTSATAPVALHALTNHLIAYKLPLPTCITPPRYAGENLAVRVRWEEVNDWLASVHMDTSGVSVRDSHDLLTYQVRLPDLGVRLEISALRPQPKNHPSVPRQTSSPEPGHLRVVRS
jgi:hypothetical protein